MMILKIVVSLIVIYTIIRVVLNSNTILKNRLERLMYNNLKGHYTIGRITVYGLNAMHFSINIQSKKYGWVCFRPITFYKRFPIYFYISPNGTPSAATYYKQLGNSHKGKELSYKANLRRWRLGHNYKINDDKDWRWGWLDKLHNL